MTAAYRLTLEAGTLILKQDNIIPLVLDVARGLNYNVTLLGHLRTEPRYGAQSWAMHRRDRCVTKQGASVVHDQPCS